MLFGTFLRGGSRNPRTSRLELSVTMSKLSIRFPSYTWLGSSILIWLLLQHINFCSEILFSKNSNHIQSGQLIGNANQLDWFLYDTSFYWKVFRTDFALFFLLNSLTRSVCSRNLCLQIFFPIFFLFLQNSFWSRKAVEISSSLQTIWVTFFSTPLFLGKEKKQWKGKTPPGDLVTFTEEILNGKLHFLCSEHCR